MSSGDAEAGLQVGSTTCFRHAKRETAIRCTRCERFVCSDCRREAPVGYQCVECVREGRRSVRQARTFFGGRVTAVPVVTCALIVLNVLAFFGELVSPGIVGKFDDLGDGLVGPDGGYYFPEAVPVSGYHPIGIAHGEWYRLITSAFLHQLPTSGIFGITHIVFNMIWLWILGRALEGQLGRVRFLALYVLSALGGAVLVYVLDPTHAAIGASGAIFGLAACYFVLSRRWQYDLLGGGRIIVLYLVWMAVSAGIASWQGHLGGLLTGGVLAVAFAYAPRERRTVVQWAAGFAVLVLLVAAVAVKTSELTGAA